MSEFDLKLCPAVYMIKSLQHLRSLLGIPPQEAFRSPVTFICSEGLCPPLESSTLFPILDHQFPLALYLHACLKAKQSVVSLRGLNTELRICNFS